MDGVSDSKPQRGDEHRPYGRLLRDEGGERDHYRVFPKGLQF